MEKVKKHLESAFKILSSMYVNKENVDIVAAVRQELRNTAAAIDEVEKTKDPEEVKPDVES